MRKWAKCHKKPGRTETGLGLSGRVMSRERKLRGADEDILIAEKEALRGGKKAFARKGGGKKKKNKKPCLFVSSQGEKTPTSQGRNENIPEAYSAIQEKQPAI